MLERVLAAGREAGCGHSVVVVGHGGDEVREAFAGEESVTWVEQGEPRGTGDAVRRALDAVAPSSMVLILSGDAPLIRPQTLTRLLAAAEEGWGAMAVATLPEPGSLGRVLARADGSLERIVEAADASAEELSIGRVNAGFYALPAGEVAPYLTALEPDNAKGELYLTDAVSAAARGHRVALVELADASEALGVNDRRDLALVMSVARRRKLDALMATGVTVIDPERCEVDDQVAVGRDTILHPGVVLLGSSTVGESCEVQNGAWIRDSQLGEGVTVEPYCVIDGARLAANTRVGPFARLRPGAVLERGAKVGNFVEVKNATLGEGAKANHLSYLGDASVGAGANIGAGVVTCNYDGRRKNRTEIGAKAFVGSDAMLVAPVKVGAGATVAAGSVITKDVAPGALAIERSAQRQVADWEKRRRRSDGKTEGD